MISQKFDFECIDSSPPVLKATVSDPAPVLLCTNPHQNYMRRRRDFSERGISPLVKASSEPYMKKLFTKSLEKETNLEDILESSIVFSQQNREEGMETPVSNNDTFGSDHVFDEVCEMRFERQLASTPDAMLESLKMTKLRTRTPLDMSSIVRQVKDVGSNENEYFDNKVNNPYPNTPMMGRFCSLNSTPDSKSSTPNDCCIVNPFDSFLSDRLNTHTYSPSIFATVVSPNEETTESSDFQWSIDHVALINPTEIKVRHSHQVSSLRANDETESRYQSLIDKYFADSVIAPSPWSDETKPMVAMVFDDQSPQSTSSNCKVPTEDNAKDKNQNHRDAICQTMLTLPPGFDLLQFLGEKFLCDESNESNGNASGLRRKLFHCFDKEDNSELDERNQPQIATTKQCILEINN